MMVKADSVCNAFWFKSWRSLLSLYLSHFNVRTEPVVGGLDKETQNQSDSLFIALSFVLDEGG